MKLLVMFFGKESSAPTISKSDEHRPLKKKKTSKSTSATASTEKTTIPVESLSFKSLIPGTLVLGKISEINRLDIALSLPDNLIGYVPITSISVITKQLEEFEESDSEDEDDDEDSDEDLDEDDENKTTKGTSKVKVSKEFPSLSKLFRVGQWLRAVVVESNQRGKKKQHKSVYSYHSNLKKLTKI